MWKLSYNYLMVSATSTDAKSIPTESSNCSISKHLSISKHYYLKTRWDPILTYCQFLNVLLKSPFSNVMDVESLYNRKAHLIFIQQKFIKDKLCVRNYWNSVTHLNKPVNSTLGFTCPFALIQSANNQQSSRSSIFQRM